MAPSLWKPTNSLPDALFFDAKSVVEFVADRAKDARHRGALSVALTLRNRGSRIGDTSMGNIAASAFSMARSGYEGWQSFGPIGLAGEFLVFVVVASTGLWLVFRSRSAVFWKRTDYAYFLFAVLGGAAGAADLAVNNWNKQLEQAQMSIITNTVLLRGYVSSALLSCDRKRERAKEQAQFGRDVIKPKDPTSADDTSAFLPDLSDKDCKTVVQIGSDIQEDTVKSADQYGIGALGAFRNIPNFKIAGISLSWLYPEVMPKIAVSLIETADARGKERALKLFFSFQKPITNSAWSGNTSASATIAFVEAFSPRG